MAKSAKEERDLTSSFVASMTKRRPYKAGAATFDIVMSDKTILGDVRYVLLTGIDAFDKIVGGFPFGRINEVFGLENCGKTAMMIRAMCRFQANHIYEVIDRQGFVYSLRRVNSKKTRQIRAYVDNEHSLERGFKITINDVTYNEAGEEVSERVEMKTALMMCDTVDQIFEAVDHFIDLIKAAEIQEKEREKDEKGSGRMVFGLFLVDTVAGTSSKEELEREWGKRDYPRHAQQISEGFRCMTNEISRHNVAMICTNQVRTKFKDLQQGRGHQARFNTPQADDFSTFGGKALSYYSTHRVFMFRMPIKYTLVKGAQFPAGYLIGFRTDKNRLRKPGREGRIVLLFDEEKGGLHDALSILESMIFLRVAKMQEGGGAISFLFRKHGITTTTFAENIILDASDQALSVKPAKRVKDPQIDGRYEWLSFYKAHRSDLNLLWDAAMRKAYETEGLGEFYAPPDDDDDDDDTAAEDEDYGEDEAEAVSRPAAPRRKPSIPTISDEDL
jgi:RecA/RadA recombinase